MFFIGHVNMTALSEFYWGNFQSVNISISQNYILNPIGANRSQLESSYGYGFEPYFTQFNSVKTYKSCPLQFSAMNEACVGIMPTAL